MTTSLTDGTLKGTIPASPVVPTVPTPPVTPASTVGAGDPLTGLDQTARIPDAPAKPTAAPVASAPTSGTSAPTVPTPSPTAPAAGNKLISSSSPVYDAKNNITGYNVTYQDGTTAFNPSATPATTGTTGTPGTPPTGMSQADYDAFKKANPNIEPTQQDVTRSQLAQAQQDYQDESQKVQDTISGIQSGATPLTPGEQAQVDGIKQQFAALINTQTLANTNAVGIANTRGYQSGAAEYDRSFQVKTIGAIVTAGANKIADLQVKEASAVAQLTQAFKTADIAAVKDAWSLYQDASDKKTAAIQKTITDTQAAIKQANDDFYNRITKPIQDIATDAGKNGASSDIVSKISSAKSVQDAINAAGDSLQTATGQLGDYLQYKRDATAKGLTPQDYGAWKAADDAQKAKADASAAYSKAFATKKAEADATNLYGNGGTPDNPAPDSTATGITGAAGISLQAFNYLTQGTASMSRMSAAQRNAIMSEANSFLNKNGLDVSTFQSQYKAYNSVLEANIERANNTKIFGGEISGTVDQFVNDIGDKLGSLKAGNVAKLFAGQQVNDPTVQKYSFDLTTMRNDLAGYYAASRTGGSNATPDDSDKRAAEDVLLSGLNTKSATAFKQSINDNETKVTGVVNAAVDSARKQVWDLFGVGSQYKAPAPQANPVDAVNEYVKSNPAQGETIAKLYEVPGATDQDVLDYIQQLTKK